ncbi:Speckle-type POZ protein-like, partial [Orchesella cincta]
SILCIPGTSPSFNEEGDCVFKFESSREKSRFLATIQEGSQFEGDVCIWLLAKSPIEEWTDGGIPLPSAVSVTSKILEKQIDCDFELIAENGKRFKCHKLFLAVSSPVLARMLDTECEEMKNKAYQMSLSEEGVKTFLDFIYRAESMESIPSPAVSLELLEAAHKYDVSALEVAMKALFLKQKSEWMEVDVAVMLYLHARNVKGYEPLMWTAIQVIKSKPAELMKSKLFDELLKNDPAAKEILVRAIKTGSPSNESARKKFKRSD